MTKVQFAKKFRKQLQKAPDKIQVVFEERLDIFLNEPYAPLLNNHQLHGKYMGLRSINVSGDWRALFKELENGEICFFVLLGTHCQLYG